jgi:KipI family sensor histidine kinase inhibitor
MTPLPKDETISLHPLGLDGVLVRFADTLSDSANRAALAFHGALVSADWDGVSETATSLTSVLVRFRPDVLARGELEARLRDLAGDTDWAARPLPEGRRLWRIPVAFGGANGPQLDEAANAAGVNAETAIAEICEAELRVLALGFAPGQPYLGFLPGHWDIPRQSAVTAEVPAGAVVVAVRQVIPFANAAPTGWRQVGRTAFRCYDADREVPLPLRAGDSVRFEPVDADALTRLEQAPDRMGGAVAVDAE